MFQIKILITLVAGCFLWAGKAFAAQRPGVDPQTTLQAGVCVDCPGERTGSPYSLLVPIFYPSAKLNIQTIPRTPQAAGDLMAIGMVTVPGVEMGSGTAITPCDVLTSYHVVFAGNLRRPSNKINVEFRFGSGPDNSFRPAIQATPVAWGPYKGTSVQHTPKDDWVLLRLKQCIGPTMGIASELADEMVDHGVSIAGILKQNYHDGLHRFDGCAIDGYVSNKDLTALDPSGLEHLCPTIPGSSGAPIFTTWRGRPEIVAINAGEQYSSEEHKDGQRGIVAMGLDANTATPISSIEVPLRAALKAEEEYIAGMTGEIWSVDASWPKK